MSLIYHVVAAKDWESQESESWYKASSLEHEGFIHLSTEGASCRRTGPILPECTGFINPAC